MWLFVKKRYVLFIKTIVVLIILIVYAKTVMPYWDDVQNTSDEISIQIDVLTQPPESNTIELPMHLDFESTEPLGVGEDVDFSFILELTYPNGSLIANDVIHVKATAVITRIIESLDHITLAFPNSLLYPKTLKQNRLPAQGILVLENPLEGKPTVVFENYTFSEMEVFLVGEANITFPIEGEYRPIMGFEFKDNSTKNYEAKNTILHVYPKEQLKQLETERIGLESNLASLELSKAVFILSTIAVFSIVIQIFSYNTDKCKYQPKKKNTQPNLIKNTRENPQTPKKKKLTKKNKRKTKK